MHLLINVAQKLQIYIPINVGIAGEFVSQVSHLHYST